MSDVAEIVKLCERVRVAEAKAEAAKARLKAYEADLEALLPGFLASRTLIEQERPLGTDLRLTLRLDAPTYSVVVPYTAMVLERYPSHLVYRVLTDAIEKFARALIDRMHGQLVLRSETTPTLQTETPND